MGAKAIRTTMNAAPTHLIFVMWSDEDDSYLAIAPQLQGCMAHGSTREEAVQNLEKTIADWMDSAKEFGWNVPPPLSADEFAKQVHQSADTQRKEFERAVRGAVDAALQQIVPEITA